jgi:hypothetical protein
VHADPANVITAHLARTGVQPGPHLDAERRIRQENALNRRNNGFDGAKVRETSCSYVKSVDDINAPQAPQCQRDWHSPDRATELVGAMCPGLGGFVAYLSADSHTSLSVCA